MRVLVVSQDTRIQGAHMFGKVFATVFFATLSSAHAFEDSRPQASATAPIEVGVLLESTSIRIRNFATVDQVLIFESDGLKIYRSLPVGTELDWSFSPHALDGVNLEVASIMNGAWRYTGTLSLSDYAASGSDTLWVQPFVPHSISWLQFSTGFAVFASGASYLPTYLQDCAQGSTTDQIPNPAAVNLPVITPSNTPAGDGPPNLDKNQIPPM
jgi:hypothetical protein